MANIKEYQIKINGITESVKAVDSLTNQLNALDAKVKELESKSINIKVGDVKIPEIKVPTVQVSSNGGSTSTLSQEVALQKELNNLKNEGTRIDAKIEASQTEIYRKVQATKELYKEAIADQKQMEAQERLIANSYSNTMAGMKQHLADLKTMINTTDLGDSDKIKQMTQEANELTTKLKTMEEAYGQFGRNVGNYKSAADGFNGLAIQVGNATQEFANAKQAYRELANELRTLQVKKDQGMILSEEEVQRFKELPNIVAQLKSSINDAGRPMDALMDSVQSIVALAQAGKGISAFFGLDGDEIERSVQQLVALQNAMKGLETINKQLQSGEFMGGMLTKANGIIDEFAAKLTGAKTSTEALTTATEASTVASEAKAAATATETTATEASTVAQNTNNVSTNAGAVAEAALTAAEEAQTVATTQATVATKALSLALKSIGIGLVIAAVAALIEYWEDIVGWFEDTVPAVKNLGTWFEKLTSILSGVGLALVKWVIAPFKLAVDVISAVLEGRFKDLPKVIGNSLMDSYNVIENYQKGHNKAVENQQKKHNKKMREEQLKANEEAEKDAEARYGKDYARTQKHYKDQLALLDQQLASVKKGSDEYKKIEQQRQETQRKLWASERSEREENQKKAEAANKKYSKDVLEAENELVRLRISNMKEGLRKTITQLEEERKAKLAKVRQNGIMVAELEAEINKEYDKKIEDARREHAKEVVNIQKTMYDDLINQAVAYEKMISDIKKSDIAIKERENEIIKNKYFNQNISSYGIQSKSSYSPSTQESLGIISTAKNNEMIDDYKKLIDIMREYSMTDNALKNITLRNNNELGLAKQNLLRIEDETNEKLEQLKKKKASMSDEEYEKEKYNIEKEYDIELQRYNKLEEEYDKQYELTKQACDAKKQLYDNYNAELAQKYHTQEQQAQANATYNALIEESYTKDLSTLFNQRMTAVETYWKKYNSDIEKLTEDRYKSDLKALKNQKTQEVRELENSYQKQIETQEKWLKKKNELIEYDHETGKLTEEEYHQQLNRLQAEYNTSYITSEKIYKDERLAIDEKYKNKEIELEIEKIDKLKKNNAEYYQDALQEFRDFQTSLNNLASKQPVMNAFGIVNLKQANKNNRELLQGYEELARQIAEKRRQLTADFQNGIIDSDAYQNSLREMDSFVADLGDKMDEVKHKMSFGGQWEDLARGINQWVQMIGQGISSIMSSLSEITQNQYAAQISQQEKYIQQYQDLLNKQKEATQKYADEVNSIEDDLKTARGDRRQQLIDQLNAQMAAQRASFAQEKKLEKEKEKAEEKKRKLEHDQAVAKKKMDLAQAFINMSMAISMAAVNHWPIPAIPMMALAAATAAAQIAAIQSRSIPSYGSGGVIQGKSHAQGGVKVLGGRAEVEGGEFITNKTTTQNNVELLDFINSRKKRLNLNDMLEFYGGKTSNVKKVISNASPMKFADGGQVPLMSTNIELNDRLVNVMEDYSNRPVVVSVVDINNQQAAVRNVEVLSGLNE